MLAQESQDTVISAYLAGLLEDSKGVPAASYRSKHHHRAPQGSDTPCRGSRATANLSPNRSSRLLPFDQVVGSRILPSPLRPSPPGTPPGYPNLSAMNTAATATTGSPKKPSSVPGSRRSFSRGEQQRDPSRQQLRRVVYSRAYLGGCQGTTSSAGRPKRPTTAPSGATTGGAVMMAMARTRRGATAPGCSTATPRRGYGGGGTDHSPPHERRHCFNHDPIATTAAGATDVPGTAACYRQQHLRLQQQQQLVVPPRHHAADFSKQNDREPFLVCRSWRKVQKDSSNSIAAPSRQAEAELARSPTAAASSPSPEDISPGFGECRSSLGSSCGAREPETLPRNMFLTRTHRCGDGLAPPA